ncbi:MAG TPA: nicotinate-nucleotide adenylyltransferase [Vicinamibacterales bacterium]
MPFGILGGTFDPIHLGHLAVAAAVERALGLDRILLVPARTPPHRSAPLVSIYHRFAMVALAAMTAEALVASDLDLDSSEPSYTSTLLERFAARGHTASQMVFITGADAFAEIATWRHYPAILDRAHFAVVSRPGLEATTLPASLPALADRFLAVRPAGDGRSFELPETPRILLIDAETPDVSSTQVRERAREGGPLTDLLPASVAAYVRRHGLYLDAPDGRCIA